MERGELLFAIIPYFLRHQFWWPDIYCIPYRFHIWPIKPETFSLLLMHIESTVVITSKIPKLLSHDAIVLVSFHYSIDFALQICPSTKQSSGNCGLVNIFLLIYSIDYIALIFFHQITNCYFLMRCYSG